MDTRGSSDGDWRSGRVKGIGSGALGRRRTAESETHTKKKRKGVKGKKGREKTCLHDEQAQELHGESEEDVEPGEVDEPFSEEEGADGGGPPPDHGHLVLALLKLVRKADQELIEALVGGG
jgi:hypothetical protein